MNSVFATVARRFEPVEDLAVVALYIALAPHVWTVRTSRMPHHRPHKECSLLSIAIEDFPDRILCTFPTPSLFNTMVLPVAAAAATAAAVAVLCFILLSACAAGRFTAIYDV
jgi:hypothetical protein